MPDISTQFAGLNLKSPVIAGSSAINNNLQNIIELEKQGVGAIVLKSLFEEEIIGHHAKVLRNVKPSNSDIENLDYLDYRIKDEVLQSYIQMIREAKQQVDIPIIGSINCVNPGEWIYFAKEMEKAGADAIEINLFAQASSNESEKSIEDKYMQISYEAVKNSNIPIILKISHYFSNLSGIIHRLSRTGVSGMVLFNRFFMPDINVKDETIVSDRIFSESAEIGISLRWIALMANRAECDLAASTGIHNARGALKQILAGASAVQVVSALYKHGADVIKLINDGIQAFMSEKSYNTIDDFKGKLSYGKDIQADLFERVQFMKYFSNQKNEKILR